MGRRFESDARLHFNPARFVGAGFLLFITRPIARISAFNPWGKDWLDAQVPLRVVNAPTGRGTCRPSSIRRRSDGVLIIRDPFVWQPALELLVQTEFRHFAPQVCGEHLQPALHVEGL